jgi:hypothetical protein
VKGVVEGVMDQLEEDSCSEEGEGEEEEFEEEEDIYDQVYYDIGDESESECDAGFNALC